MVFVRSGDGCDGRDDCGSASWSLSLSGLSVSLSLSRGLAERSAMICLGLSMRF